LHNSVPKVVAEFGIFERSNEDHLLTKEIKQKNSNLAPKWRAAFHAQRVGRRCGTQDVLGWIASALDPGEVIVPDDVSRDLPSRI
jgi:hypothetical protein